MGVASPGRAGGRWGPLWGRYRAGGGRRRAALGEHRSEPEAGGTAQVFSRGGTQKSEILRI